MIALKIICLLVLLPFLFVESVIKGMAHFVSLVWMMVYCAFVDEDKRGGKILSERRRPAANHSS